MSIFAINLNSTIVHLEGWPNNYREKLYNFFFELLSENLSVFHQFTYLWYIKNGECFVFFAYFLLELMLVYR